MGKTFLIRRLGYCSDNRNSTVSISPLCTVALFTMGPDEAAFAVSQLIKPRSVIPEHFNQVSTNGGVLDPNTGFRLARFIQQLEGQAQSRVIVPLSGTPISCDGQGNCS